MLISHAIWRGCPSFRASYQNGTIDKYQLSIRIPISWNKYDKMVLERMLLTEASLERTCQLSLTRDKFLIINTWSRHDDSKVHSNYYLNSISLGCEQFIFLSKTFKRAPIGIKLFGVKKPLTFSCVFIQNVGRDETLWELKTTYGQRIGFFFYGNQKFEWVSKQNRTHTIMILDFKIM